MKRETNRTQLQEVIPLETPMVLHIEPTNACNFKCKFCSDHDDALYKKLGLKRGFMEKRVFEKVIDDCGRFPDKIKRICLHHRGEPLLHPEILEFIRYAKEAQVAGELVMFTNGALLTEEYGTKLANAGLDFIQISVEGVTAERYREVTGCSIDYEAFLKNIEHLYREKLPGTTMHAKIVNCGLSDWEKEKFYHDFSGISDDCYIESLLDVFPSDIMDTTMGLGQTTTQDGKPLCEKLVCTQPFYVTTVSYDGAVSGCSCGDWRHMLIMGSVLEESLYDVWHGKKYTEFRRAHLRGERKCILSCGDCKTIMNQIDDIDAYREDLLQKLNSEKRSAL